MSEEKLYGIWNIRENRWSKLTLPNSLRKKYNRYSNYIPDLLFFSLSEIDILWGYHFLPYSNYYVKEVNLDQENRIKFAMDLL